MTKTEHNGAGPIALDPGGEAHITVEVVLRDERDPQPATAGAEVGNDDIALTVPETARRLGISDKHAWTLVHQGEIPSVLLGSSRRVPVRDLVDHLSLLAR